MFDRPFSDDELRNNAPQVLTCNDLQREVAVSQNIAGKHIDRVFTFDKVPKKMGFSDSGGPLITCEVLILSESELYLGYSFFSGESLYNLNSDG